MIIKIDTQSITSPNNRILQNTKNAKNAWEEIGTLPYKYVTAKDNYLIIVIPTLARGIEVFIRHLTEDTKNE